MPAKGFHHRAHGDHRGFLLFSVTSVSSVVNSFPFACFKHDTHHHYLFLSKCHSIQIPVQPPPGIMYHALC
jgi:hypothetical protein